MHLIIGKERWNFRKLLPEILVIAVLSFLVGLIRNGFNGITGSYLENCDKTLVFWHVITLACIHISIRFKITVLFLYHILRIKIVSYAGPKRQLS